MFREMIEYPDSILWYFCAFLMLAVAGVSLVLSVFECAGVFK